MRPVEPPNSPVLVWAAGWPNKEGCWVCAGWGCWPNRPVDGCWVPNPKAGLACPNAEVEDPKIPVLGVAFCWVPNKPVPKYYIRYSFINKYIFKNNQKKPSDKSQNKSLFMYESDLEDFY